jgi:hypothetical protein
MNNHIIYKDSESMTFSRVEEIPKVTKSSTGSKFKNKMAAKVRVIMLALKSWLGDKLSEGAEIRLSEVMEVKVSEGIGATLSEGMEAKLSMGNGPISCKGMRA